MIQIDARIGGQVRLILTDKLIPLMMIPDEIRKCVAFIGFCMHDRTYRECGTGFFLIRPSEHVKGGFTYLVTAKHIIDAIKDKGLKSVCVRIKKRNGATDWLESPLDQWLYHPTDEKTVDVAILRIEASDLDEFDYLSYSLETCKSPEQLIEMEIGLGNEVSITGLFKKHFGKENMIPIVRVGNIAAMPEELVSTDFGNIEAYLIEARSTGGLSGSPIFVSREMRFRMRIVAKNLRKRFDTGTDEDQLTAAGYYLLGMMQSHFDDTFRRSPTSEDEDILEEQINMGIAVAVPANKILEVINQPMVKRKEQKIEDKARRKQSATLDILDEDVTEESGLTREGFFDALRKVSRPISSPSDKETPKTSE